MSSHASKTSDSRKVTGDDLQRHLASLNFNEPKVSFGDLFLCLFSRVFL